MFALNRIFELLCYRYIRASHPVKLRLFRSKTMLLFVSTAKRIKSSVTASSKN